MLQLVDGAGGAGMLERGQLLASLAHQHCEISLQADPGRGGEFWSTARDLRRRRTLRGSPHLVTLVCETGIWSTWPS